ncbi:ParB/RepB/Spo0J family partition protein [Azospirillum thermophilum]|uniref:Chromosome partitioning protein n=1 Tax=Azospirillum thermophilum TaxID=2202148 RepID=A0A2S2D1F2_9PROT|nr:ParB/RepB/Spo0J family partition protein [Azospirillum thermophilum]AWK90267.1 chromosome partitioning protein [Azospirillum thermophilum]
MAKLQRKTATFLGSLAESDAGAAVRAGGAELIDDGHPVAVSPDMPRLVEIDLDRIEPNPDQPRTVFREEEIRSLAESIERVGLQQPVVVRQQGRGFLLMAGERRLRAHQMLGRRTIFALISRKGEPDEVALIENIQRVDLDAVDLARGLQRLIDRHGYTHQEVAAVLRLSDTEVSRRLKILALPASILAEYQASPDAVSRSVLSEIAYAEGEAEQRRLWELAKQGLPSSALRAERPKQRAADPYTILGNGLKRIGREIAAMRAVSDAMATEHKDRLRSLRAEIDSLLAE